MSSTLVLTVVGAALVLAVWTALTAAFGRPVGRTLLAGLAVAEVLLVVQLVAGIVAVARGDGPPETVTFLAYLVGELFVLPVAALWSLAEQSRPSVLVLTVACLGLAVMGARLLQLVGSGA